MLKSDKEKVVAELTERLKSTSTLFVADYRDLNRLLARVTAAEGKLVLAGDTRQLPAIRAGGALGALATRLDPIELRQNRRQRETWEREAVELLRNRDGERALDLYERQGRLRRHDPTFTCGRHPIAHGHDSHRNPIRWLTVR